MAEPMNDPLVQFQTASLQRHAIDFGEWMMLASLRRAHERGHPKLRPAHARLFTRLSWEGARPSEIARQLDVSKNAVGQLVAELVDLGYLERTADPRDGRATIVRYTARGREMMADALDISEAIDAELAEVIGREGLTKLRDLLARLDAHMVDQREDGPRLTGRVPRLPRPRA